jgi:ABC-type transporter lipoprotein component MlaA
MDNISVFVCLIGQFLWCGFTGAEEHPNESPDDGAGISIQADVAKVADVVSMFELTLSAFGKIDIAVANAGVELVGYQNTIRISVKHWEGGGGNVRSYLVIPLLGPSTVRDAAAKPVDLKTDLWGYKYPVDVRNTGSVIRLVDRRASLLDASTLVDDAALDRYVFVRDAFLQQRASKIYKGDPMAQ